MKLTTYHYEGKRIAHVEFPTHLSMVLAVGRVQEFAEHVDFEGQWLTMGEFFDKVCAAEANDDYIPILHGVNLPGSAYLRWLTRATLTLQESRLHRVLGEKLDNVYIIGSITSDKVTLDHEIAHALYNFSEKYAQDMQNLLLELPQKYIKRSEDYLIHRKYSPRVFDDERQAFFSTSSAKEIWSEFGVDPRKRRNLIARFKAEKQKLVKS